MISLIVKSPNLKEEIRFPATYEELQLALWKLGLVEHDPATYTIGSLATEFRCQSEVGERIAELILSSSGRWVISPSAMDFKISISEPVSEI